MRVPIIAANWKMNKGVVEACQFVTALKAMVKNLPYLQVVIVPSFVTLYPVSQLLADSPFKLGAQDLYWEPKGAFTGAVSPLMLKEVGCDFVIVGHSERRQYFAETDETVRKKVAAAMSYGLTPILCVGESEKEREEGKTFKVLESQLTGGLKGVNPASPEKLVLAYEPVWAIGTGKTATSQQAEEAQAFVRELVGNILGKSMAQGIRIIYGGSVTPENIAELMRMPNVDGALVGGASLEVDSFARIIAFDRSQAMR